MPVGYVSWAYSVRAPGVVTPVYTLSLINYHIVRIKHYTQAQRRMLSLSLSNFFFFSIFAFFPVHDYQSDEGSPK